MNNFFCNHKTQKSDPEHTFSEIDINYRRDYSKGKSFKVSIWNEVDTYNNDDFIQDFVIYNQILWVRADSTPSTNEPPTEGPWIKVMEGVSDVQFKEEGNKIFWKYEDESEWKDLFELDVVSESEIKNMLKDIATNVDPNFYDETLSETSGNAVQNQVITKALNKKADKTELSKKQDVISDLSEIRNKAKSALQSVPSEYITEAELNIKNFATKSDVALVNTSLSNTNAKFADYYTKDQANVKFQPKGNYLTEHQDISGKQDKITDLAQIRSNAQKGATALQAVPAEYATKTDVSKEVSKIVNSAPEAFNTLKEIADWIEEDAEPAIVLANKVENKVDKVAGKGLSANDYTTAEKNKLAGLQNYDDSKIRTSLEKVETQVESQDILIEDLQDRKADTSGYYPRLHVGLSDNLPDRGDVTEGFIGFRESAGAGNSIEDGTANVKELLGNSVVWNQLFNKGVNANGEVWVNNSITINVNNTSKYQKYDNTADAKRGIITHKYLQRVTKVSGAILQGSLKWYSYAYGRAATIDSGTPNGVILEFIGSPIYDNAYWSYRDYSEGTTAEELVIRQVIYDLTQMFGAGNEPTTIEEFYARIPMGVDLNAYNEGEVIGVNAKGFKSVNDNAWDEEWENGSIDVSNGLPLSQSYIRSKYDSPIKVLPNTEYYIYNGTAIGQTDANYNAVIFFYDKDDIFIKRTSSIANTTFTTPQNCEYVRFYLNKGYGTTYKNDICIRLAHSGYKTDYVAHEEAYSSFDLTPYFPNGMHAINGVRDSATPSEAIRRFGVVDLGTFTYRKSNTSGGGVRFRTTIEMKRVESDSIVGNILCSQYDTVAADDTYRNTRGIAVEKTDGISIFNADYTDAAALKASLQGVMLYYELAEPIETEINPQFNMNYKVWDFGTEELLTDSESAQVLTRTIYGFNATDTIRGNKAKNEEQDERLRTLESEVVRKDDYQPDLAVGLADNLSGVDVVDSEVNFRRSGGGAISDGVARIEAIKGNSVVWNQLFSFQYATMTSNGVKITKNADNSLTCVGTLTDTYFNFGQFQSNIENHKYLFILDASAALDGYHFGLLNRNAQMSISGGFAYIFHTNSDISKGKYIGIRGLSVGNEINENLFVRQIDLTKAFPNDWQNINTIEEFYARIPMGVDLNAYNEGEVIYMDVQSIESQGVNAWDGTIYDEYVNDANGAFITSATRKRTGYIKILPNASYYIKSDQTSARWGAWYDKNKNYVGKITAYGQVISPSNAEYCALTIYNDGNGNPDTFCINISDASINGKYFPYIKRVEDLSIIRKYFPQGMKKAGTAHDEIRYNKVTQKWEYSKGRFRSVDLGTFNWIQATATDGFKYYYTSKGLSDAAYENKGNNILTPRYTAAKKGAEEFADKDMRLFSDKLLYIRDDAYTDAASFKASLQGVILYYESNDWEWVELDAEDQFRDLDYQVWNCGTEKAIAEGKSAPLAADITYGFNAIGKIKELENKINAGSGGGGASYDDTQIKKDIANLRSSDTQQSAKLTELSAKVDNINPTPMISVTYAELVNLRDNEELVPGMQYRITDYVTTTAQENTRSAEHQFDVIVTADNENTLNEVARACMHDGDNYFSEAGANLAAWQIWYSLDNDTQRFAWADAENGKGVIYRMIDEWNNDIPYDFKNIQFKRNLNFDDGLAQFSEDGVETWVYTFAGQSYHINNDEWSGMLDGSLESPFGHMSDEYTSTFHDNIIGPYIMLYNGNDIYTECGLRYLNDNVFLGYWEKIGSANDEDMPYYYAYCCNSNSFGHGCYSNSFGDNCSSNSFGHGCYSNSFGNDCGYNSFGDNCSSNSFGHGCYSNSFGDNCYSNSFGHGCNSNSFGHGCNSNSFGHGCNSNSFGNDCYSNSFGNDCYSNSFGNDCGYNSFGNSSQSNELRAYYRYITFGEGVQYVILENDISGDNDSQVQNYRVANGVQGNYREKINFFVVRDRHPEVIFDVKSDGDCVEICLADSTISRVQ